MTDETARQISFIIGALFIGAFLIAAVSMGVEFYRYLIRVGGS